MLLQIPSLAQRRLRDLPLILSVPRGVREILPWALMGFPARSHATEGSGVPRASHGISPSVPSGSVWLDAPRAMMGGGMSATSCTSRCARASADPATPTAEQT